MANEPVSAKQLSAVEINEAIADFKAWLDDARNARSADKLAEHLTRLAFLSARNSTLHHILTSSLPSTDISSTVELLKKTEPQWHGRSVPIEWPIDPDARLAMQFAFFIALGEARIEWETLLSCSFGDFGDFLTELFVPATRDFERLLKRIRQEVQNQASEETAKAKPSMATKRHFSLD